MIRRAIVDKLSQAMLGLYLDSVQVCSNSAQACSPSAQAKAAAAYDQRL